MSCCIFLEKDVGGLLEKVTDDLATTGLFSLAAPFSRLFLMSPHTQKSKWDVCLELVGVVSDRSVCVYLL